MLLFIFLGVTVLGSHNEKLPLCLFATSSSLNVTLARDESPAKSLSHCHGYFPLECVSPRWCSSDGAPLAERNIWVDTLAAS